jgi:hypothetical protein
MKNRRIRASIPMTLTALGILLMLGGIARAIEDHAIFGSRGGFVIFMPGGVLLSLALGIWLVTDRHESK